MDYRWTDKETAFLKKHFTGKRGQGKWCAEQLNKNVRSIYDKAASLYLVKPEWTKKEVVWFKENYSVENIELCMRKLGRTRIAIDSKAHKLNIKVKKVSIYRNDGLRWSKEDLQFIRDHYLKRGSLWCSKKIGRSPDTIRLYACSLNVSRNWRWTKQEERFLIDNYYEKGCRWCAEQLGSLKDRVASKACGLKLRTKRSVMSHWTEEQINFLVQHYSNLGKKQCAEILLRSKNMISIRTMKYRLFYNYGWTKEKDDFLKKYYPICGIEWCAKHLGFTFKKTLYHAMKTNIYRGSKRNSRMTKLFTSYEDRIFYKYSYDD